MNLNKTTTPSADPAKHIARALWYSHHAHFSPAVSVVIPVLDGDRLAFERHGHALSTWGRRERRIVANLISHLEINGFVCKQVDDGGDDLEEVDGMKSIMEAAFAVDEATLVFTDMEPNARRTYEVDLIFNNGNDGLDVISDHSAGGRFGEAMDSFDAEVWA